MKYHQLTLEERYLISMLRMKGLCNAEIARFMSRHRCTIGREVERNKDSNCRYAFKNAQSKANGRRRRSRRNRHFKSHHLALIVKYLRLDYSPEQIAGTLKRHDLLSISHEASTETFSSL